MVKTGSESGRIDQARNRVQQRERQISSEFDLPESWVGVGSATQELS